MDFTWTPEQIELRERARKVATEAVERFGRHNDSWINGYSKEFAKEMAAHGWIGMTWPTEFGGGGRPADRAADRRRGDDQGRRADRRDLVRRSADGTVADHLRHDPISRPSSCRRSCRARRRGASG